jgi:hypothetical protein
MGNKIKKTLNNILYGIPLAVSIFLPINKAHGQMTEDSAKYFSSKYADLPKTKIEEKNSLYLVLQPCDLGFGLRYDRRISPRWGVYSSLSKGNYKFENGDYINDHNKIALGGLFYLNKNSDGSQGFFSGGLSHHTYGRRLCSPGIIDERVLKPISIEFGGGINVEKIRGALRFDFIKKEGSCDLGFSF